MVCPQNYYNYYPTVATVVGMVSGGTMSPWISVKVFEWQDRLSIDASGGDGKVIISIGLELRDLNQICDLCY